MVLYAIHIILIPCARRRASGNPEFGNGDKLVFTEQQRFGTDRVGIIIGLQRLQELVLKPVFDFEFHHRNDIHTMTVHDLEFNWKYRG